MRLGWVLGADAPHRINRIHGEWRWRHNFGTGDMGNDSIHDLDIGRWGLGVDVHPTVTLGGKELFDGQEFPATQTVIFEWPSSAGQGVKKQLIFEKQRRDPVRNGRRKRRRRHTRHDDRRQRSGLGVFMASNQGTGDDAGQVQPALPSAQFLRMHPQQGPSQRRISRLATFDTLKHLGNIATAFAASISMASGRSVQRPASGAHGARISRALARPRDV